MEKQLINELQKGLPPVIKLIAYNYSHAGTSLYALLCQKRNERVPECLTLRIADHPLWLENAQQLFIDYGKPADLSRLAVKIDSLFKEPKTLDYFYKLSSSEITVLQFFDACQKQGIICAIRLP